MEISSGLLHGLQAILNLETLLYCLLGVVLGQFIGALPGLGSSAGCSILLPVAFTMGPTNGLIMLCGIYYGSMYGGTVTAVLLNIPGEADSVLTGLEGHKLAKKGRGGVVLGVAAIGSFVAGTAGVIALTFFAPILAEKSLLFGPAERFAVVVVAFAFLTSLTSGALSKSIVSLCTGLIAATVGMDNIAGVPRLTVGTNFLMDGIKFVPVIMGFYAMTEIMKSAANTEVAEEITVSQLGRVMPNAQEMKQCMPSMARGGLVGFLVGCMPGGGATVASFISYGFAKRFAKRPEEFGQGSLEAIAAVESSNNGVSSGAMIPLMALAIPGTATTAVLLSGFLIFGLPPGPQLFIKHPDIAYGLIASMYVGNAMLLVMNMACIPFFVWAVKKSTSFMSALVVTITIAGVYSLDQNMADVWQMLVFALIGFILARLEYPLIPVIVGLVLGGMFETSFRTAMLIGYGNFTLFFEKPICVALFAIAALVMGLPPVLKAIQRKREQRSNQSVI
jgi:putative tricarboxylic transport membrane protein